jgi:uncharacterized protein (DUF1800 family)
MRPKKLCLAMSIAGLLLGMSAPLCRASTDQTATDTQIVHFLNRISFGPAPDDIEAVRRLGFDTYLEQQLHPELLPASQDLAAKLAQIETLNVPLATLADNYEAPEGGKKNLSEDEKKELNKRQNTIVEQLAQAKILRAIMSPAQLQEVMVDFWFNHFNVFAEKGFDKIFISSYERDAIRPFALGKFRDLLQMTARHPAMLFYLDNWLNTDPKSVLARRRNIGINENYAREVMELHTLGVEGGYTQQDVTTLAHIFTGWGLGEGPDLAQKATFFFDFRRHDYGNKAFLGYAIRGNGEAETKTVLDLLAQHPSSAHHIAFELAQFFVGDGPPSSLVERLAAVFRSSGGDISAVLRALFRSPEFWDPQFEHVKFKPPFRFVVSAFRAAHVLPPGDTRGLQGALAQMGEPLYRCLTPNGYSATNDQWLNSDALFKRISFLKNMYGVLKDNNPLRTILATRGTDWSANTLKTVLGAADTKQQPLLLLGSPEFVYY